MGQKRQKPKRRDGSQWQDREGACDRFDKNLYGFNLDAHCCPLLCEVQRPAYSDTTAVYLHVNDTQLAEKLRRALSDSQGESELERLIARMLEEKLKSLRA